MKKIIVLLFCAISLNCFAQEDLKFSKALFISLSSDGSEDFIAKDTTIVVPNGKVWFISNAKVYMIYDNRISGKNTYLYLDDQIISYSNPQFSQNTNPFWLPSGSYRINIRTEDKYESKGRFSFNGFLSGIEYSVGYIK